jgi:hypothetical protein
MTTVFEVFRQVRKEEAGCVNIQFVSMSTVVKAATSAEAMAIAVAKFPNRRPELAVQPVEVPVGLHG